MFSNPPLVIIALFFKRRSKGRETISYVDVDFVTQKSIIRLKEGGAILGVNEGNLIFSPQ